MVVERVGAGDELQGGVEELLHGGLVVVLLEVLGDELGVKEGIVAVREQVVVLDVEGADGGAQAVHRGRGHGGEAMASGRNPKLNSWQQFPGRTTE